MYCLSLTSVIPFLLTNRNIGVLPIYGMRGTANVLSEGCCEERDKGHFSLTFVQNVSPRSLFAYACGSAPIFSYFDFSTLLNALFSFFLPNIFLSSFKQQSVTFACKNVLSCVATNVEIQDFLLSDERPSLNRNVRALL